MTIITGENVIAILMASVAISAILIWQLQGLLKRYALAHPNARSSHRDPTPQGGGIAVVVATLVVVSGALLVGGRPLIHMIPLFAATILIALVGAWDDIAVVSVAPRLVLQIIAAGLVIATLPADLRVFSFLPLEFERVLLLIAGLWFINLVNFMDGIDWMTVAEILPVSAGLALLGMVGALPQSGKVVALALVGAILGFAPFNRPVARVFLGDVGSLPIGLLVAWLLLLLAANGYLAAAILLPLYYIVDATVTLLRRLLHGQKPWQAHRDHFYQQAVDRGLSVMAIVSRVFAVNLVLIALALTTVLRPTLATDLVSLAVGCGVIAWLGLYLERGCKAA